MGWGWGGLFGGGEIYLEPFAPPLQGPVSTGVGDRLGSPLGVAGFFAWHAWGSPNRTPMLWMHGVWQPALLCSVGVLWAPARVPTVAGLGQYWGGGPPGKPIGCCWIFAWHAWSLANCTSLLGSIFWAAAALPPPQPQLGLLGPGRLTSFSPGTPI